MTEIRKAIAQLLVGWAFKIWPNRSDQMTRGFYALSRAMGNDAKETLRPDA